MPSIDLIRDNDRGRGESGMLFDLAAPLGEGPTSSLQSGVTTVEMGGSHRAMS
jgi:hypothetical protein